MGWAGAVLPGQVGKVIKELFELIPTYLLANGCLIAIAVEMRDTNALRADGPDNWSILCCGREGTTTKERDLSCKTDDSHLDETTPEPWPCLAVCKWTGITYPALIRYLFTCFV